MIMKQTVEEAAKEYYERYKIHLAKDIFRPRIIDVFKSGAEWQANQSPWISVEDSLPEMQQRVLVIHKLPKRLNVYIMKRIPHDTSNPNNGKWHWSKVTNDNEVTHWMPIPSFDEILEANKDVLERIKEKGD